MRKLLAAAVLWVGASACGDSTGPQDRALLTGRYAYTATGTAVGGVLSGTLTITYSSADSVAGTWSVQNSLVTFEPAVQLGKWNEDAFLVWAKGTNRASYTHRLARSGNKVDCYGLVALGASFVCDVQYLGK